MKIPKGMTEAQVLSTINKVVSKLATKFRFGYYDTDDIKQEGYIIALEGLERYDESRPLENFLFVHVKNRLISFKRDNYIRKNYVCTFCQNENPDCEHCHKRLIKRNTKQFLIEPLDISNVNDEFEPNMWDQNDVHGALHIKECLNLIDKHLGVTYRADYLKMKAGVYISKSRRAEVEQAIRTILEEHGHEIG